VELVTSKGHRARDIRSQSDARHSVCSLGPATQIAPGLYSVIDNRGRRFVAEIHPQPNTMSAQRSMPIRR
jgi:hypothetical protein